MSYTIAKYRFNQTNSDSSGWKGARNRLHYDVGSGWSDSYYSDSEGYIEIKDDCSNPGKAAEICKSFGGSLV